MCYLFSYFVVNLERKHVNLRWMRELKKKHMQNDTMHANYKKKTQEHNTTQTNTH